MTVAIRAATPDDAASVADVWWRSRQAAIPAIPAPVHDEADVVRWVADVLIPAGGTWVALEDGRVVAMLSLSPGWIDQLYVEPPSQGRGAGARLVHLAKERSPGGLELWTFESNAGARRFYECHGFTAVEWNEGDNEEGAPSVRYRWGGTTADDPADTDTAWMPRTSPSSSAQVVTSA